MKAKTTTNFILNIIIIALSIFLLILSLFMIFEVKDYARQRNYDESTLIYELSYQNYDQLLRDVLTNEQNGVKTSGDMPQLYAVAHYYNASVRYCLYAADGNTQMAQKCLDKMEECAQNMGEYSFAKEDIDRLCNPSE